MQTRPDNTHGQAFPLPASFTEVDTLSWVVRVVEEIKGAAASEFDAAGAKAEFERYKALLTGKSGDEVLLWFSGKDLFGTLESFFRSSGINDPAAARETILRWMEQPENLATVMAALPEWRNLVRVVNE